MFEETGLVRNIHALNHSGSVVQFTLCTLLKPFDCLIENPEMSERFLLFPEGKYLIKATGEYNSKHQLIISTLKLINPDNTSKLLLAF